MFYRQMADNENMDMESEEMLTAQQMPDMNQMNPMNPMMQQYPMNPMMQQYPMNPMMQHQMGTPGMPFMCYPMMHGMYNPSTYGTQMPQMPYQPMEGTSRDMERVPYNYPGHHGYHGYHHGYPYHNYYPYYNYYPYNNLSPLIIPLLFGGY